MVVVRGGPNEEGGNKEMTWKAQKKLTALGLPEGLISYEALVNRRKQKAAWHKLRKPSIRKAEVAYRRRVSQRFGTVSNHTRWLNSIFYTQSKLSHAKIKKGG